MVKKTLNLALVAALFLTGAGCGGSDSSSGSPGSSTRGRLSFTVTWPPNGRFIARNANKVIVRILDSTNAEASAPLVFLRNPAPGFGATQSTGELPEGTYTVSANSYNSSTADANVGSENPLSSGSTSAAVVSGSTTSTVVTLASTLTEIAVQVETKPVAPAPPVSVANFTISIDADDQTAALPVTLSKLESNYRVSITPRSPDGQLVLFTGVAPNDFFDVTSTDAGKMTVTTAAGDDTELSTVATHTRTLKALAATATPSPLQLRIKYTDNKFDNSSGSTVITFKVPIVVTDP